MTPEGFKAYYAVLFRFSPTNNEAEYEALIAGLQHARQLGAKFIRAQTDSALVVGQVNGEFVTKGDKLTLYRDRVLAVLQRFEAYQLSHILEATVPCIESLEVEPIEVEQDQWITDLKEYLQDGRLPQEEDRARKVKL